MHPTATPDGGTSDREEYYESIEMAADVIEQRLEDDPAAEAIDLVWREVDSSEWIIYYDKNMTVLQVSDNEPNEWKHLVSDTDNYREVLQAMAYKTMEQDLYDELRERDLL